MTYMSESVSYYYFFHCLTQIMFINFIWTSKTAEKIFVSQNVCAFFWWKCMKFFFFSFFFIVCLSSNKKYSKSSPRWQYNNSTNKDIKAASELLEDERDPDVIPAQFCKFNLLILNIFFLLNWGLSFKVCNSNIK